MFLIARNAEKDVPRRAGQQQRVLLCRLGHRLGRVQIWKVRPSSPKLQSQKRAHPRLRSFVLFSYGLSPPLLLIRAPTCSREDLLSQRSLTAGRLQFDAQTETNLETARKISESSSVVGETATVSGAFPSVQRWLQSSQSQGQP